MAKALESSPDSAVLVLGHSDLARNEKVSYDLSKDRATAVASIFRLSGLNGYRMSQLAMGSSHTLPTKRSAADNDRVEIIVVPTAYKQDVMAGIQPSLSTSVGAESDEVKTLSGDLFFNFKAY